MDKKEEQFLSELHDLVVFGKIERELELFPFGEDAPPLKVVIQTLTTREKKEMLKVLEPYLEKGIYYFNLFLEQHVLARVVKSINGREWRNFDEALSFFDLIQDNFRQFLYKKCYEEIATEQSQEIVDAYTGIKTVAKLKNLFTGDSPGVQQESPSETTGSL